MKYKKRVVQIFLLYVLTIILMAGFGTKKVNAESISNSVYYTLGTQESGFITENGDDKQYYMFTLPESGSIKITGSAYMQYIDLYVYDENANELWNKEQSWNSTSEVISINHTIYLTSGTYYFCVGKDGGHYGGFDFKIDFNPINESFNEINGGSNNAIANANSIDTDGTLYTAQIAVNDEKDFFKFVLHESGKANFNALFYEMEEVYWKIYSEEGIELLSKEPSWNSTTKNIVVNDDLYLTSGTYYIAVSESSGCTGKYTFSLPFSSSEEAYVEVNGGSNNSISSASSLDLENDYKGQIALNDEKDFYAFTLDSSQSISINVQAGMEEVNVYLYDFSGNELSSWNPYWNDITKKIDFKETKILAKGKYYVAIVLDYGNYGDYILNISPLTKNNCPHKDYDSEWHDSTYFTKGYREYICQECGYSYKTDYEPVKRLDQGYLYSYCYAGKRNINVYWSTITDASGYQIRYCTRKDFKSDVLTRRVNGQSSDRIIIGKLKRNKNYYVQVRAYKTYGSKTVYGKWSGKIKLKTK